MQKPSPVIQDSAGRSPRQTLSRLFSRKHFASAHHASFLTASRQTLSRLFSRKHSPAPEPANSLEELRKKNAWLMLELQAFQIEKVQFGSDEPLVGGLGRIGEIVPPIAGSRLRATVSSPSLAGYLFIADAWHSVLSRFLQENSTVLDIGCGCGKMARNLLYHPYVKHFIGIDAYKASIDYCQETIVPRSEGRFEFHFLDVYSNGYYPQGKIRGTEVVFPAGDGTIDFAFAASLFTHLLEEDSRHYLHEVRRAMAPDGIFLPSITSILSPGANTRGMRSESM